MYIVLSFAANLNVQRNFGQKTHTNSNKTNALKRQKQNTQSTPSPNLNGILKHNKTVCPGTMQEVNYVLSAENKRMRENTWNCKAALNSAS